MREYNLFETDGKTYFEFRSDPTTKCNGFTLSYLKDGTVTMSGDYGSLSWKRIYIHAEDKEEYDYGFPNKDTNIGYFAEKICQHGIPQVINGWNYEKAIEEFKEIYQEYAGTILEGDKTYEEVIEDLKSLGEGDKDEFWKIVLDWDCDAWEHNFEYYTDYFEFVFVMLKGVSEQVLKAVNNKEEIPLFNLAWDFENGSGYDYFVRVSDLPKEILNKLELKK